MKINEELENKYRINAISHFNASKNGDYKIANKNYNELIKIYKKMEKNKNLYMLFLEKLLDDKEDSVKLWAASHCLGLNIFSGKAICILTNISKIESKDSPTFEAKKTLEVWFKQGYLKFY